MQRAAFIAATSKLQIASLWVAVFCIEKFVGRKFANLQTCVDNFCAFLASNSFVSCAFCCRANFNRFLRDSFVVTQQQSCATTKLCVARAKNEKWFASKKKANFAFSSRSAFALNSAQFRLKLRAANCKQSKAQKGAFIVQLANRRKSSFVCLPKARKQIDSRKTNKFANKSIFDSKSSAKQTQKSTLAFLSRELRSLFRSSLLEAANLKGFRTSAA